MRFFYPGRAIPGAIRDQQQDGCPCQSIHQGGKIVLRGRIDPVQVFDFENKRLLLTLPQPSQPAVPRPSPAGPPAASASPTLHGLDMPRCAWLRTAAAGSRRALGPPPAPPARRGRRRRRQAGGHREKVAVDCLYVTLARAWASRGVAREMRCTQARRVAQEAASLRALLPVCSSRKGRM
jgi:hypothetical protein